jgi:hypothetical protein
VPELRPSAPDAATRYGPEPVSEEGIRISDGVERESLTGARRLYERAGMHVARRFDVFERA